MKSLYNEEELYCTKTDLWNYSITLLLAKLDIVGSRLLSNGSIFVRRYFGQYPVSNFFIAVQL